jgi:uncharacterized protein YpmB
VQANYPHFVELIYKPLKAKEKKVKYQGKSEKRKGLVVRLPVDLKHEIEQEAARQGISQSRLVVELISHGINQAVDHGINQAVDIESVIEQIEPEPEPDDQTDIEDWLRRI